jgi:hypothetical protein
VAGCYEHGNETSGSINSGEFLDRLKTLFASQDGLCSMEFAMKGMRRAGHVARVGAMSSYTICGPRVKLNSG